MSLRRPRAREVGSDGDDHVFLAGDHAPAADLDEHSRADRRRSCRRRVGVAQEAGVHAGVAERQRLAVDGHGPVLQRADQLLGGVLQRAEVAAVRQPSRWAPRRTPRAACCRRPRPCRPATRRPGGALLDGGDGVGDRRARGCCGRGCRPVPVERLAPRVTAATRAWSSPRPSRRRRRSRAGVRHESGLLGERRGLVMWVIIRTAGVHAELAGSRCAGRRCRPRCSASLPGRRSAPAARRVSRSSIVAMPG